MIFIFYSLLILILIIITFHELDEFVNNIVLLFISVFFIAVFGLRDIYSGSDTLTYANIFIFDNYAIYDWELGFQFISQFIRMITDSADLYILILAFISVSFITLGCRLIDEKNEFRYSPFLLIFILSSFTAFDLITNGLRQGVAISIAFYGVMLFTKKSIKLSIFYLGLSCFFHNSIALLLLTFFLSVVISRKVERVKFLPLIAIVILLFVWIFNIDLFENVLYIISLLPNFEALNIYIKISNYSARTGGLFLDLNMNNQLLTITTQLFPLLFYMMFGTTNNKSLNIVVVTYSIISILYSFLIFQSFSYRYLYLTAYLGSFIIIKIMSTEFRNYDRKLVIIISLCGILLYTSKIVWMSKNFSSFSYF